MFGLRRALRDRTGSVTAVRLSDAQRELVSLVRRRPGLRVGEAAADLQLAPNTVSTLVTGLCSTGWLQRTADVADARSARLELTDGAAAKISRWRDRRQSLAEAALQRLTHTERRDIAAALPALQRLLVAVKEGE